MILNEVHKSLKIKRVAEEILSQSKKNNSKLSFIVIIALVPLFNKAFVIFWSIFSVIFLKT